MISEGLAKNVFCRFGADAGCAAMAAESHRRHTQASADSVRGVSVSAS
jgi:hypothetical protein